MTKEQSLQLKGVAILMMLWLHLFNTAERVAECTTCINFLNGKPLVYALARVAGLCVPIYLFISGYGLAKSTDLRGSALWRRLRRVYSHYWLVFIIFIPIGCFLAPVHYPGNIWEAVLNFFSLSESYNQEWWFLLPYVVLLVLARWIVPFIRERKFWQDFVLFLLLFLLATISFKVKGQFSDNLPVRRLIHFVLLLPAFYGGVCCGSHLSGAWYDRSLRGALWWLLLLLFVRCFIGASIVNVLFCIPFILLFIQLNIPQPLQSVFRFFGRHSTFMWLTHTFYAYYFFHDELYGLHYPLVMYVVLLVASLLTAMVLNWILGVLNSFFCRPSN